MACTRIRHASYLIAHLLVFIGSGIIYYEYEKREKFKDYDLKADADLGTFKIRRYHFDGESFVHPLHGVRFDPDCPCEVPIEALMADQPLSSSRDRKSSTRRSRSSRRSSPAPHYSPKGMSSTQRVTSPSPSKASSFLRRKVASKTFRMPKSWELIPPSEGWMCEEDEEEKEIGGIKPSIEKKEANEYEEEEEDPEKEDPEEEVLASTSLPMDIDATEDYLQFIEELERRPEYSPIRSSNASVPDSPEDPSDRQSDGHNTSSYDLSGVWQPLSSVPRPSTGNRCKVRLGFLVASLVPNFQERLSFGFQLGGRLIQYLGNI
ncbi:hypothetical protein PIB30_035892 [Stylosanthes scabra]|uniref:Uncharacterized protein n=1 Tax=Stylosanthes scabra TaxID=79078 RepID=A0ABU6VC19_9FABA|nr:hypothetical protein [Stylosanthes scabra]